MQKRILMKYYLLPIVFLATFSISQAQLEISWQRCFGGSQDESARSIRQTFDNGYILAGYTRSVDGDIISYQGADDFWILKTDSAGNLQWQKNFGGSTDDRAYSVIQTSDSGYIAVGETWSDDGDVSGNNGARDYWVIRLDDSGNLLWQKCLGGTGWEFAYDVVQTPDGGFVVGGSSESNIGGSHGYFDYMIFKLDASGNQQWVRAFGGTNNEMLTSMIMSHDNGIVITGYSDSYDGDISASHGWNDVWIVKTDLNGTLLWEKSLGGSIADEAGSIILTSDHGFILAGSSESDDGDLTMNNEMLDYWVVKMDSAANIQWQKSFGGAHYDWGMDVLETKTNRYAVVGTTASFEGEVLFNHGVYDFLVLMLDSAGNVLYQKSLGSSSQDECYSIAGSYDNGIIIGGQVQMNDGDVSGLHGFIDLWLAKVIEPQIQGKVFHDADEDGILDPGEQGMAGHLVSLMPGPQYYLTDALGNYYFGTDTGTYNVQYLNVPYWVPTGVSQQGVHIGSSSELVDNLHFGAVSRINVNDVAVYITGQQLNAGFPTQYWITWKNRGTNTVFGELTFNYDDDLMYVGASVTPATNTGNTLTWLYDTLGPGSQRTIHVDMTAPGVQFLGDTMYCNVWVSPLVADSNLTNNYDTLAQVITGSYDPNDKAVNPTGIGQDGYVLHGQRLRYTIRFQNTGTDTAITVVVRDTLDQNLDMASFELDMTSHPADILLLENNELVFRFNNILLPDSNVNEPGSHGFIRYSISPKTGLADFTQVFNTAYIFFDYNPAVITNTELTTYVSTLTETATVTASETVRAWPNPSPDIFYINLPAGTKKIEVYDANGRLVRSLVPDREVGMIDMSGEKAGLYSVKIITPAGFVTSKIVVK